MAEQNPYHPLPICVSTDSPRHRMADVRGTPGSCRPGQSWGGSSMIEMEQKEVFGGVWVRWTWSHRLNCCGMYEEIHVPCGEAACMDRYLCTCPVYRYDNHSWHVVLHLLGVLGEPVPGRLRRRLLRPSWGSRSLRVSRLEPQVCCLVTPGRGRGNFFEYSVSLPLKYGDGTDCLCPACSVSSSWPWLPHRLSLPQTLAPTCWASLSTPDSWAVFLRPPFPLAAAACRRWCAFFHSHVSPLN